MRVFIENSPVACALAHMWLPTPGVPVDDSFVYLAVSDGVGAGVVVNGEVLRGYGEAAGEFGHVPLSIEGPLCLCGLRGCWEAYTSDIATRARYLGLDGSMQESREALRETGFTIGDLMMRARAGDLGAVKALQETGRYLGIGLAVVIRSLSPACVIVGGEISGAWDLIGDIVHHEARERALIDIAVVTSIIPTIAGDLSRLRGAAALLIARFFAAPKVV
jgi:N-acetylglucosamine repressor